MARINIKWIEIKRSIRINKKKWYMKEFLKKKKNWKIDEKWKGAFIMRKRKEKQKLQLIQGKTLFNSNRKV